MGFEFGTPPIASAATPNLDRCVFKLEIGLAADVKDARGRLRQHYAPRIIDLPAE
jgi:hypothetical protein